MTDPYQAAATELSRLLNQARERIVVQALEAGLSGRLVFVTPPPEQWPASDFERSHLSYEYLTHDGLAVGLVEVVLDGTEYKVRVAFNQP